MPRRLLCLIVSITAGLFAEAAALAAVPSSISIQGKLTDAAGAPPSVGAKSFTFRIYDDSVGGTKVWPASDGEAQTITTSTEGLWAGLVGAVNPLTAAVFADSARWLQITVDDGVNPPTTLPRIRLVTGPYAYRVATVDGASGGIVTGMLGIITVAGPTSYLQVGGAVATNVTLIGGNITLDASHSIVICGSGTYTVALPHAATCPGRMYMIKKATGSGSVSITAVAGYIEGNTSLVLDVDKQSYTLVSDGVDTWYIID